MPPRALFLLLAGFAFPWAWSILRTLWSELAAASEPPRERGAPARAEAWPLRDAPSAPPRRRRSPGFRSARVLVEEPPRWQGGFGRRSL